MPLEDLHLVLLPHITLPRLERFSTVLYVFFHSSDSNELIRTTLSPFLVNHGPTLRSLKLEAFKKVDMSSALLGLPRMPCLKSLHISHLFLGMEPTSFAGHHQFLETHQSQLQHFTFDFVGQSPALNIAIPDEFFNQEWCRVLLPELQSLSLQFHRFIIPSSEAAIPYLQRHIPTVETLIIHALQFSYEQISSILMGPTPGGYQLTRLRILDIQIWCFSPAFLSLLVRQAPHLQSLKLTASVIGPDKQPARFGRNRVPEVRRFPILNVASLEKMIKSAS
ncbi:hypothetical protein M413DRAFT_151078 [Hebeloma cylindrosporum]|uniref:F-box domain-containing protein n=1 Tax=Hebeloma cylindrosporum TaxID=76867 RepID=A0A0C2YKK2_HEBCY|nr:hypothetical protein M413DRAFT_151078 [Hebeloma cylindrosporum h7]